MKAKLSWSVTLSHEDWLGISSEVVLKGLNSIPGAILIGTSITHIRWICIWQSRILLWTESSIMSWVTKQRSVLSTKLCASSQTLLAFPLPARRLFCAEKSRWALSALESATEKSSLSVAFFHTHASCSLSHRARDCYQASFSVNLILFAQWIDAQSFEFGATWKYYILAVCRRPIVTTCCCGCGDNDNAFVTRSFQF